MIHSISSRIARIFVLYGESSEEDVDIYIYATEAIVATLFSVVIAIVISLIFGRVVEGLVFISSFALLRRYTGGYHAESHFKCILHFNCIMASTMVILHFVSMANGNFIALAIATLSLVGICVVPSATDKNVQFTVDRQLAHNKKSVVLSILMWLVCVLSFYATNLQVGFALALSMLFVFCGVVCSILQDTTRK